MLLTEKIGDMNVWEFVLALFLVQLIVALLIAGVNALLVKH